MSSSKKLPKETSVTPIKSDGKINDTQYDTHISKKCLPSNHLSSRVDKFVYIIESFSPKFKGIMAVKHINLPNKNYFEQIQRDISEIRKAIGPQHIVESIFLLYKDLPEERNTQQIQALICTPYMDYSLADVYGCYHNDGKYFPLKLLRHITARLVNALCSFGDCFKLHGNIKPSNILFNRNGDIKLCDYGISRIIREVNYLKNSTCIENVRYWPPEQLKDKKQVFDYQGEVWCLGITLTEIILGEHPFNDDDHKIEVENTTREADFLSDLLERINEKLLDPTSKQNIENEEKYKKKIRKAKHFIAVCLKPKPERATCKDLLNEEFYKYYESEESKLVFLNSLRVRLLTREHALCLPSIFSLKRRLLSKKKSYVSNL